MMKKRFLVGVFMVAVVALSVAQVLTQTWTSATISMHAGTVSTVGIALFEDCATTVPINSWDWNGVTQGNTYELHVFVKNTGTETLRITYLPTLKNFYDNQAQFRLDVTVMEYGMPCQLYLIDPWVSMDEKLVANPELGYELPPGKVIKVDIELEAIMVVSGGVYDWEFSFYGASHTGGGGHQWDDGFESTPDHYVNWDVIRSTDGDTVTAYDAVYYQGGWSSKSTINDAGAGRIAWAMKKITATKIVSVKYYFRTDTLPDTSADGNMILSAAIIAQSHLAEVGLYVDGGLVKWVMGMYEDGGWAVEFSAIPVPQTDRWYSVEVYVKVDANKGEYRLYVDGALVISRTNVNNAGLGDPDQIRVGVTNSAGQASTVHIDSVRVY